MRMRAKISLGFLVLAFLLLFSGMVSYFELKRLNENTAEVIEKSSRNIEISNTMLDALHEQNIVLMQSIALENPHYDTLFYELRSTFDSALEAAESEGGNKKELEAVHNARDKYYSVIEKFLKEPDRENIEKFSHDFRNSYFSLSNAVSHYMTESQHSLQNGILQLQSTAYRATTPGIITLSVTLIIVLVFAFFIDIYYTKPILRMNKGLGQFIDKSLPYSVKVEGDSDMEQLNENVETVINMYKKK